MQRLGDRVYVLPGGTNIGIVIADDGRAVLIDSGLNDTPARKALRAVREELGTEVRAILNTHGHADHFGGNAWLVKRTGATVIAPEIESWTIRHPLMQPIMLYGGADPADPVRTKFLIAESGPVDREIDRETPEVEGIPLRVVPLPGHSMNQFGYLIDDVFFCADVVFPEVTLEKYPIPYLYSLTEHLESLDVAAGVDAPTIVPGHGPVETSLDRVIDANRAAIEQTITAILDSLSEPMTADAICQRVFTALNVPVTDAQSYYLLKPTMSAYLAHLERTGAIALEVVDAQALWQRR